MSSQVLSVTQFEQALQKAHDPQLIDVRTPKEVAEGKIQNAINYDFYGENFQDQMKTLDPNKPTFVYCKSGGRSGKTATMLQGMKFKEVYDLDGGFTAWKAEKEK